MIWKSLITLVIGIFISSVMFVISFVSNNLNVIFFEDATLLFGPIILLLQVLVLFLLAYFSGFFYSIFFKNFISEPIMNISAVIIFLTKSAMAVPFLHYIFVNDQHIIAIMYSIFTALFYFVLFFFFVKWCLEQGSIASIKKVAPELIKDQLINQK